MVANLTAALGCYRGRAPESESTDDSDDVPRDTIRGFMPFGRFASKRLLNANASRLSLINSELSRSFEIVQAGSGFVFSETNVGSI